MQPFTLQVRLGQADAAAFADSIYEQFESVRQDVQGAMGECFFEIVRSNFGKFGIDRPISWIPLTPDYAKRVGRDYATLFVSGALESAIQLDNSEPDFCRVSVSDDDVPYATVHQFGGGNNVPARPYFPIDSAGYPTPYAQGEVTNAAMSALAWALKG